MGTWRSWASSVATSSWKSPASAHSEGQLSPGPFDPVSPYRSARPLGIMNYEEVGIIPERSRAQPGTIIGVGPGLRALPRISPPRTLVNKGYLRRLRLPRLPRFGYDAKLLHHPQVVAHPPVFHGLAVPNAHEVHVILAHRSPRRGRAHKRPFVGAAHRQAARDDVPFCYQLLDLEVQVREGRAQHIGQPSHRLRATVPPGRSFVVYELGGDELVCNGEVPCVQ